MDIIEGVEFDGTIKVPYKSEQERLFKAVDPASIYHKHRLQLPEGSEGRQRHGNFAELVVLRHLVRVEGYEVLFSESQPISNGYILGSFPGMRGSEEENYTRMFKHFDRELIEEFNRGADQAKRRETGNAGGGDPDLFAY